jgi:hypothetical protein
MSPTAQSVGCDFYAIGADRLHVETSNSLALEFVFAILGSHSLSLAQYLKVPIPSGRDFFVDIDIAQCVSHLRREPQTSSHWMRRP